MVDFQLLAGPGGIPIYFQRLPVRSVSIYWLVFVGSADDDEVGNHGIHHWFEHIPSRGTQKFPGGYRDTEARLVRHGGSAGAETDSTHTAYYADVPKRVWTTALDILTDMIARPLLRPEDIEAEREIIGQEIDEWHSSPYGEALCSLPEILWAGHPLGHDQLGSRESLQGMSTSLLQRAHDNGYNRERGVLFVAGDLEPQEVLDEVARAIEFLPHRDVAIRRSPGTYGALPAWQAGEWTRITTRHEDSIDYLLFPVPSLVNAGDHFLKWCVLEYLLTAGDLGSPLHRIVREESQLAYSPDFACAMYPDGGYWGLYAQTSCDQHQRVIETFWQVLRSEEIRSVEWFEFVTDCIRGEFDMHDPSPGEYTEMAAQRLTQHGNAWSDDELRKRMLSVSRDELIGYLDQLSESESHVIIFSPK